MVRVVLFHLLLLFGVLLSGCTGDSTFANGGPGVPPPVNEFTLRSNVLVLGGDVVVVSVGATEVVLEGNVPDLQPGMIIIVSEGNLTFARTVVSVTRQADGRVRVTTTTPGMAEIFESANIQQNVEINPEEIAAQLDPGIPGLTISTAAPPQARGVSAREPGATLATLLEFKNASLFPDYGLPGEERVPYATVNGRLFLRAGFQGGLQIQGDNLVQDFRPYCLVQTDAEGFTVTFHDDAPNGAVIPLTNSGVFVDLPALGVVNQRLSFDLSCVIGGNIDPDVSFTLNSTGNGEIMFNGAPTHGSLVMLDAGQLTTSLQSTMRLTSAPPLQSVVDFDATLIRMGVTYTQDQSPNWADGEIWTQIFSLEPLRVVLKTEAVSGNAAGFSLTPRQLADFHLSLRHDFYRLSYGRPVNVGSAPEGFLDLGPPLEHVLLPNAPIFIAFEDAAPDALSIGTDPVGLTTVYVGEEIDLTALGAFADGTSRAVTCQWAVVDADTNLESQAVTLQEASGRRVILKVNALSPVPIDVLCQHRLGRSARLRLQVGPARVQTVQVRQFFDAGPVMDLNERRTFESHATYTDGTIRNVTGASRWSSTNPQVLMLADNVGTSVGVGSIQVQATFDGVTGSLPLEVRFPVVIAMRLLENLPTPLAVNQSVGLNVLAYLSDGSIPNVTNQARFLSGDVSVANIANAILTGVARGFTWIRADFEGFGTFRPVEVGDAQLLSIALAPNALAVNTGGTGRLTATGNFANGTQADLSNRVLWRSLDESVATVDATGQVTGVRFGEALIQASMGQVLAQIRVRVVGATMLAITAAPTQVTPGGNFTVTAQIQDLQGNLQNSATNPVSISLGTNPAGGTLSGTLTRNAVGGQVTFDDLSLDNAGNGYTLVVSSPLLTSATSAALNVQAGGGADVGFLFVANNGGATPGLQSTVIRFDGSLTLNGAIAATNVTPTDLVHLGSNLYAAVAGNVPAVGKVTRFAVDAAGTLTNQGSAGPGTNHLNGPIQLGSNGLNALFLLQAGPNQVTGMLLDAGGAVVQQVSQSPVGAGSLFGIDAFRNGTTDLVFMGDQGFGASNDLWVLTYDRSVNPPTLTNGIQILTPGVPGTVQSLRVLGTRLYMGSNAVNSSITRYDIAGGTLTNETNAFTYTAVGNVFRMSPVVHPTLGQLMLVAHRAPNGLSLFRVEASGNLTQLSDVATGNNPNTISTASLVDQTMVVYVTTDNGVEAFLVDGATGALTAHPLSPFTGFFSPWGLTR